METQGLESNLGAVHYFNNNNDSLDYLVQSKEPQHHSEIISCVLSVSQVLWMFLFIFSFFKRHAYWWLCLGNSINFVPEWALSLHQQFLGFPRLLWRYLWYLLITPERQDSRATRRQLLSTQLTSKTEDSVKRHCTTLQIVLMYLFIVPKGLLLDKDTGTSFIRNSTWDIFTQVITILILLAPFNLWHDYNLM